jgi:hypothetical protein
MRQREHAFSVGIAVVAAVLVFAGFARTYYLRPLFGRPALAPLVRVHGALFTSWFVLLLIQVGLVSTRRTDWHRRMGAVGAVVAAAMFVVGVLTAARFAKRGGVAHGSPVMAFIAIPLGILLTFGVLVTAALLYRDRPHIHKRLMVLATIAMLPTAISRLPFAFIAAAGARAYFGLTDALVAACMVHDGMARRRVHPAYLWGAFVIGAIQVVSVFIGATHAWLTFARWLTSWT